MTSRNPDDPLRGYRADVDDADDADGDRPTTGIRMLGGFAVVAGLVLIILSVLAMTGMLGSGSAREPSAADSGSEATSSSAPPTADPTSEPTSEPSATETEPSADPDAKAPLTVLNNSSVQGLAGQAADSFSADGWEIAEVGNLTGSSLSTTTVYYSEGSDEEQAAAEALQAAFPQIGAVEPRPEELPYTGVVVVLTESFEP